MQAFRVICLFLRQDDVCWIRFRRPFYFLEMISFAFAQAKVIVRARFRPSSIFVASAVLFLAHEMHS